MVLLESAEQVVDSSNVWLQVLLTGLSSGVLLVIYNWAKSTRVARDAAERSEAMTAINDFLPMAIHAAETWAKDMKIDLAKPDPMTTREVQQKALDKLRESLSASGLSKKYMAAEILEQALESKWAGGDIWEYTGDMLPTKKSNE